MQKTKRLYQNTRTQHNIDRLNTELNEVANIMTKNLENVLWRGEGLESYYYYHLIYRYQCCL